MENLVSLLALLACPLGMGLMMWMMMGMSKRQQAGPASAPAEPVPSGRRSVDGGPDARLAELRAQLEEIRAQQAAIAGEIGRLSAEEAGPAPGDVTRVKPAEPTAPPAGRPLGASGGHDR